MVLAGYARRDATGAWCTGGSEIEMPAEGKTNASQVQINDRIIVRTWVRIEKTYTEPSDTKTGEGVQVARVTGKGSTRTERSARMSYVIQTTAGDFVAAPIQTMWLAPEDAAGVKRAHAEALREYDERQAS
jgi:hypothetical protein